MSHGSHDPSHEARHDGHVHLHVAQPKRADSLPRRWGVVALSCVAMALFVAALSEPFWKLTLYAPQYPRGLTLIIGLTGLGGDVHEIDTLNHYIGMASLADAAALERRYAAHAIAALCLMVLGATLFFGKKLGYGIMAIGAMFPLGFIADSMYWMHHFGHNLDPKAPLEIPAFTPQLFGNGVIGQFMTFALPERGFWLAVAGVVVLGGVAFLRARVCATCKQAGTCGTVCKTGFVLAKPS
jgi:copper chaperone NosL